LAGVWPPGHFGRLKEAAPIWQGNWPFGKKIAVMGISIEIVIRGEAILLRHR